MHVLTKKASFAGIGKRHILGTFKYLLDIISPIVGLCLTGHLPHTVLSYIYILYILSPYRFPTILRIKSLPALDISKSPSTSEYMGSSMLISIDLPRVSSLPHDFFTTTSPILVSIFDDMAKFDCV